VCAGPYFSITSIRTGHTTTIVTPLYHHCNTTVATRNTTVTPKHFRITHFPKYLTTSTCLTKIEFLNYFKRCLFTNKFNQIFYLNFSQGRQIPTRNVRAFSDKQMSPLKGTPAASLPLLEVGV
jgi:hypothetical protein